MIDVKDKDPVLAECVKLINASEISLAQSLLSKSTSELATPQRLDLLGTTYALQNNYDEAVENYERALRIDGKYEPSLVNLCKLNNTLARYELAISYEKGN